TVSPEMPAVTPAATRKTCVACWPYRASASGPGPWTVRPLVTSSTLPRKMVPLNPGAKSMVSPGAAAASWPRSEPAPESPRLTTVSVLGRLRSSSASSRGTNGRRAAAWDCRAAGRRAPRHRKLNMVVLLRKVVRDYGIGVVPGAQTERPDAVSLVGRSSDAFRVSNPAVSLVGSVFPGLGGVPFLPPPGGLVLVARRL